MFLRGLHEKKFTEDGIGWIDPLTRRKKRESLCIITVHGTARATFRTWAKDDELGNNRKFDQEAVELCLLHSKNDAYNGAYDRAKLEKERRFRNGLLGQITVTAVWTNKPKSHYVKIFAGL